MNYEIIVVGGGHAGCEASLAAARMNHQTLLITGNIKNIADMPCNPHIGGSAKGIVVREIDALGGIMGKIADKTHLQIKMLNSAKGPAVQSLRAQGDKVAYPKEMLNTLNSLDNLEIKEAMVEDLIINTNKVGGVILENGEKIESKIVILTTGTYLSNARSISILKNCLEKVEEVEKSLEEDLPIDMIEMDIKNIWEELGKINGSTYEEELLDEMFSRFCLGK